MTALDEKDALRPPTPSHKSVDGSSLARSTDPSVIDKMDVAVSERKENSDAAGVAADASSLRVRIAESEEIVKEKTSAEDDDYEYPKSWKLALITTALCLSVFCMALVCFTFWS